MAHIHFPLSLQGILWSSDISKLDSVRDRTYIIHQILSHGRLEDIQWLFKVYSREEIAHEFLSKPYKSYRASRFHFVKTILLHETAPLNEAHYVANTPRDIRP